MANDAYFVLIVLAIALAFVAASIGIFRKLSAMPGVLPLLLFFSASFAWTLFYVLYLFEPLPSKALISLYTMIPAKTLALAFLLLFSIKFTNAYLELRPGLIILVMLIPAITLGACILQGKYGFMFKEIEIVRIYPQKALEAQRSVWFYANLVYNYICLVASILLFFNRYRNSSVIYKWQSSLFMLSMATFGCLDFASVSTAQDGTAGILGLLLMCSIIYFSYLHFRSADLVFLANNGIIEKISSIAIVVELDGTIIFINARGRKVFSFAGRSCEGMSYNDLIRKWLNKKKGAVSNEPSAQIISVNGENKTTRRYYEVIKEPLLDKEGLKIGTFIEMRDVTTQRVLISELYYLVNYDQLTSLYNRRYFEEQCKNLDNPRYLPLTFISGDLNKLKVINDTYGHQFGDRMIVLAGEILKKFSPDRGSVCRVGGDEFIVIIPNCEEDEATAFIEAVRLYASAHFEEPFGKIEISLGHSVRLTMDAPIQEILKDADFHMYSDKRQYNDMQRERSRPYHLGL
ncbi:MAG: diguanylate cyclase [Clostridiales bacterium]|nr:diguanylate cyclase [Clostridiales bacterium]